MTKIHMTDEDIAEALDMGGSLLTYDQAIASWGYDKFGRDDFTLDDLDSDSEKRYLHEYDMEYFVCSCCGWPFLISEMADGELMEPTCESCYEEEES